jgi:hypothetical protein
MGEGINTSSGKIYEAISNVMRDVGIVGKNNFNQIQKYKFRSIDDVMNALNPAMVKNHVFVSPTILDQKRSERETSKGGVLIYSVVTVRYTFYTDDGSSVEATVVGEAMDSGDKSMNKAMSAAFKYACFQVFCIPTEEMHDSEEQSDELKNQEMINNTDKSMIPTQGDISKEHIEKIKTEMIRTGINEKVILSMFGAKKIEELSDTQAVAVLNKFSKTPNHKDVE